jgi:hypothetical protein
MPAKNRSVHAPVKFLLAFSFLALLGLPILQFWQILLLLAGWLTLAISELRLTRRRLVSSLALVLFILAARALLPGAAIEEGHNIFLATHKETVLKEGLPPLVFQRWRLAFEKQYPPEEYPKAEWRDRPLERLFTHSSDALWGPAKYTRQVDTIGFTNLSEFRGGFANEGRYGFFGQDPISLTRSFQADLPFFVMYEFSRPTIGSTLYWRGTVFWEKADGSFEEISHQEDTGRIIRAEDVGKKAYALHLPAPVKSRPWEKGRYAGDPPRLTALSMHLKLSLGLAAARAGSQFFSLAGILGVLILMTRIRWRTFLVAAGLITLSLVIIGVTIHFSEGKYLGATYPPHGGGDDGISHEFMGRNMAREFMSGHWQEALRGGQSIYWDTPGMRYVRFVEKIIFGDTNLGYTSFLALLPWFIYLFIHSLAGFRWAMLGFLIFIFCPLGSLSFLQYIQNAKLGYAEAMGFGFFILGFTLLMRSQPRWGGDRHKTSAFFGGVCLAGSMFLRPNLALAVPLLGLFYVLACWQSRDFKIMTAAIAGLALALWMPFHNYWYGHQFVLISQAGATISIPMRPWTYLQAVPEIISGNFQGIHIVQVASQLSGWLWTLPRLPMASLKIVAEGFMVLKLLTLAVTVWTAFKYLREGGPLLVLSWVALAAHLPMLFVFASAQFRYAMMAWDLSAILTIVVIGHYFQRPFPVRVSGKG